MKFTTTIALMAATATPTVTASGTAKPSDATDGALEYADDKMIRRLSTKGGKSSSMSHSTKSGKASSRSSKSDLEPYCYSTPADFEGVYKTCFASVIRTSALGRSDNTYHLCEGENVSLSLQNFTKTDDFGAYKSTSENVDVGIDLGSFQGIANGNTLPMAAFGPGIYTLLGAGTEDLIPNDAPDGQICTMFADNVMECSSYHTEYCVPGDDNFGCADLPDGTSWLNTYSIEAILALDGEECPEAPEDFCTTNKVPGGPPPSRRGLQEVESGEKTPCPFLAGKTAEAEW